MATPLETPVSPAGNAARRVDGDRLWSRHMDMAAIGAIEGDGVNRQALSAEDIRARALLIGWAEARGYGLAVDAIGNLFVRRAGADPDAAPVLTGSHMDSQPRGGRFDGIYGVLAGLEALDAMDDAGVRTRRPVEVVAWTNEEGSRFAPGCMGSMVYAGARGLEDFAATADAAGITFADALAETLAATPTLPRRTIGVPPAVYVEAHIEQGPVLESTGTAVGVVTGIQGIRWFGVEIEGETAHAGTAPLATRRDAVQGMARALAALNALTADPTDTLRFTVGQVEVSPNSINTVAHRARFTIDLRHSALDVLNRVGDAFAETCAKAAAPCAATVTETFSKPPTRFDDGVVAAIGRAAETLGISAMQLPSGAFHDAGFIGEICPAGMIFIPCRGGISHNVAEYASPDQLADGARVLAATLVALAGRP